MNKAEYLIQDKNITITKRTAISTHCKNYNSKISSINIEKDGVSSKYNNEDTLVVLVRANCELDIAWSNQLRNCLDQISLEVYMQGTVWIIH